MSTNNSPQTLFRFVSLRNPNLVETNRDNFKFIQRPDKIEGVFDQVTTTQNQARYNALLAAAITFEPNAIKDIEELQTGIFKNLVKIGKSISKQEILTNEELELCKKDYDSISVTPDKIKDIWENFIYQYITQKNFYIKEELAYILKALHVGYVQTLNATVERKKINGGTDFVSPALNAIIIIPSSIFSKDVENLNSKSIFGSQNISERNGVLLNIESVKLEKEQNSIIEKDSLTKLKTELANIRNNYYKSYDKAFNIAQEKYNSDNADKLVALQNQLDLIQKLEENNATEEELKKAYELLKSYEVPSFVFSYKKELNWEDIQTQLSFESLAYFLEKFTDATIQSEIDLSVDKPEINNDELIINDNTFVLKNDNFIEIFDDIDNQVSTINENVLTSSTLTQEEFTNVGGALIPVSNTNTSLPHLSYILRAVLDRTLIIMNRYISFQVNVENSSWSISHAVVTATTNTGVQTQSIANLLPTNNTLIFPQILRNQFETMSNLKIQIFFNNGRETTLNLPTDNNQFITNSKTSFTATGLLSLKSISLGGQSNDETPIPGKHYGLKRLGVAEYMKVVQTVHAYVPGEVSNIENVMASELRHKSISELTRTEDTITTSKTQEVEKISDTTKVNRSEMQTEVAKEIDRQTSFNAHANFSYNGGWKVELGTAFATTNSQHISNRQAVIKSQEITERALERVQTKISEERISKIIHEVNLTNVHEYDNRGKVTETDNPDAARPQHITGVYRWVDKKMKNQIYNYGKRTMFEFMIPEPARLHRIATAIAGNTLVAPTDPRKADAPYKMPNASSATKELLEHWANIYGVNLVALLPNSKQIIHSTAGNPGTDNDFIETSTFQIPENYVARNATFVGSSGRNRGGGWDGSRYSSLYCSNLKGDMVGDSYRASVSFNRSSSGLNVTDNVEFRVTGHNVNNYTVKATVNCELTVEYINAWKQENFNLIIEAYTNALNAYKEEVAAIEAEQKAKQEEQKDTMGNFYRIIEGDVLKHNCIAYLLQNYLSGIGEDFDYDNEGVKMDEFKVYLGENLDKYTSTAKFLEQAFEWSIKDYTFYPYFWAERSQWQELYLTENMDPLFRSFLQAGIARVIVTVRPGFEEAVQYFLETGKVWMGGESPVIGDPLYMSIAAEMIEPTGVKQGKYWITRIPTTLTILQAKSTGLDVEEPLPIFPELNPENCENPDELETSSAFNADYNQLSSSGTNDTTLYPN